MKTKMLMKVWITWRHIEYTELNWIILNTMWYPVRSPDKLGVASSLLMSSLDATPTPIDGNSAGELVVTTGGTSTSSCLLPADSDGLTSAVVRLGCSTAGPVDSVMGTGCASCNHSINSGSTHSAHIHTQHTYTQPFNGLLSGTAWMSRYQKTSTHSHPWERKRRIRMNKVYCMGALSLYGAVSPVMGN